MISGQKQLLVRNIYQNAFYLIHLIDKTVEMLPEIGPQSNCPAIIFDENSKSIWIIFSSTNVLKFDLKIRKWIFQQKTIKNHFCPGCLIRNKNQHLYIFSDEGVEKLNLEKNRPWEMVNFENTFFEKKIKFYPFPGQNDTFFIFEK